MFVIYAAMPFYLFEHILLKQKCLGGCESLAAQHYFKEVWSLFYELLGVKSLRALSRRRI